MRIVSSGQTDSICEVCMVDGQPLYIVDCFDECDSELVTDCVITVEEHEIEPISS